MADFTARLAGNLADLRRRIERAAQRADRSAHEITLVAVTKYVGSPVAAALAEAGCLDLGESRPQEVWKKSENLSTLSVRWHLIGHLQRNKVHRTLPLVHLIHSIDSLRLLEEIDRESALIHRRMPVLLEVNISGDASKHGFSPGEMAQCVQAAGNLKNVQVRGLMAMASREGDLASARNDFRQLRQLRDQLHQQHELQVSLEELSMGMSGDFEVAIEEGATILRIGSVLFEGVIP